jgi:hypothetical protein
LPQSRDLILRNELAALRLIDSFLHCGSGFIVQLADFRETFIA